MKSIFLKIILLIWPLVIVASDTEVIWTEFGGATSMTGVATGDQAGFSVAMSSDGSIVAVGEYLWDGVGSSSGRVRTYRLQGGQWTEFGGATSMTGQVAGDNAGWSVAISSDGSIVAVGEPFWDGVGTSSGRVRTYRLQSGVWTEFGGATSMAGIAPADEAGRSVAISSDGSIVAVGEPLWDGVGGSYFNSGRVRTYRLQSGAWTEFGGATSMTGQVAFDNAGQSVAINSDGSIVAVGENLWDGVGSSSGRVRTYRLQNGTWTEFGGATSMTGQVTGDQVGLSVAMNSDGSIVAVGENLWDGVGSSSGRVRTYRLQNGTWTEFGGATSMTGTVVGDQAGWSVAISSDGSIVAVGEPGWDGVGSSSGRVRTYRLQSGVWTEFGGATSMTGQATGDQAGRSVAINSDGTMVAVGENGWSGSRGRVRTYFYPSSQDNQNEDRIRNTQLAHACYSDISQATSPGYQTEPGGVGQGAWFTPYRIMVQGK